MIRTRLTSLLGLSCPVVVAPMLGVASGDLAGAVSAAGGFGLVALRGGGYGAENVRAEIQAAATKSNGKPFGAGLLLSRTEFSDEEVRVVFTDDRLKALWVSFFGEVQTLAPYLQAAREAKKAILVQVQTVDQAESLVRMYPGQIAAIILQGCDAGGHGCQSFSNSSLAMLSEANLIRERSQTVWPLLLTAGGISDGRALAAMLVAGADGVVCGSSFIVAEESTAGPEYKKKISQCQSQRESVTSACWDEMNLAIKWPKNVVGRALDSSLIYKRYVTGDLQISSASDRDWAAADDPNLERKAAWVGAGVAHVGRYGVDVPASMILESIVREALEAIRCTKSFSLEDPTK